MEHATLKLIHLSCITLSFVGFAIRAALVFMHSPLMHKKWMRIWPHIIDTGLLASGIWMMINIQQYPFVDSWLTAKIIALLLYIFAGVVVLRAANTISIRFIAFGVSVASATYLISVALQRTPWPFM